MVAEQLDPAHTGVTAQGLGPPLRERWRWTFNPNVPIEHEVRWPLMAGGRVFVTFHDRDAGQAQLYALDPATGATLWQRDVGGFPTGAAYGAGKVIVATQDTLHAFDAATGALSWSWTNGGGSGIHTGPVVAGGVAYVGVVGVGAGMHALDVADGSSKWHRVTSFPQGIGVGAEHVYVNDGEALLALRRFDGSQAWRAPAPDEGRTFLDGHPTVAGGRVYVPSRYDGAVYDAASGALLRKRFWTDPLPAVDAQRAYVLSGVSAADDAVLHAVDAATGSTLWELAAGTALRASRSSQASTSTSRASAGSCMRSTRPPAR